MKIIAYEMVAGHHGAASAVATWEGSIPPAKTVLMPDEELDHRYLVLHVVYIVKPLVAKVLVRRIYDDPGSPYPQIRYPASLPG